MILNRYRIKYDSDSSNNNFMLLEKKYHILIFLILILLTFSCNNKKKSNVFFIDNDVDLSNYNRIKIPVKTFHVSCKSYRPSNYMGNEALGGIVLYKYSNSHKNENYKWKLNNVKCRPGYIIIKRTEDVEHLNGGGRVHGSVYKSVFGRAPCNKIVGGGFSYFKDKNNGWKWSWAYRSGTFNNTTIDFHNDSKKMNPAEEKWIRIAVKNWIEKGQQNTDVVGDQIMLLQEPDYVKLVNSSSPKIRNTIVTENIGLNRNRLHYKFKSE